MNNLARLEKVKADEAGVSGTTTLDDALGRTIEEVSREFEAETGVPFVARLDTRYPEQSYRAACGAELVLFEPLASITSLTVDVDGDGTYELTLVENTDYFVIRDRDGDSNTPIMRLDLNPNGTQLWTWPVGRRPIKITGLWGYSYELQDTTLDTGEALDTTETDITMSDDASAVVFVGDTAVVDSEQMEVTAVEANALTVVRAINGTTAASHNSGASVYVRRYPRDVERAVSERAVGLRWDAQGGNQSTMAMVEGGTPNRMAYARWMKTVRRYKNWSVS